MKAHQRARVRSWTGRHTYTLCHPVCHSPSRFILFCVYFPPKLSPEMRLSELQMCVLDADGKPVEEYRLKREVLAGDVAVTSYSKYIIFIYGPVTCFISPASVCHTSCSRQTGCRTCSNRSTLCNNIVARKHLVYQALQYMDM